MSDDYTMCDKVEQMGDKRSCRTADIKIPIVATAARRHQIGKVRFQMLINMLMQWK